MANFQKFSELALDEIALNVHDAIKSGRQIKPLSQSHSIDYNTAVEIRRRVINLLGRYAGLPCGYKIAFTSFETQKLLGIESPEFASLFTGFQVEYGKPVDTTKLCEPFAEPEIAFVMAKPLVGPGITNEDVLDATRHIMPAIEIVDSRFGMKQATKEDQVADCVQFGRFVLSDQTFDPRDFDLSDISVSVDVDGDKAESSTGRVMGNPAAAVAWLANRFAETSQRDGNIEKGNIILSGSCTRYFPVKAGSALTADFDSMSQMQVEFS